MVFTLYLSLNLIIICSFCEINNLLHKEQSLTLLKGISLFSHLKRFFFILIFLKFLFLFYNFGTLKKLIK